jgi:hypothetical protein
MKDKSHFVQQQTNKLLQKQKRAWDLFLLWMDQADDEVMTSQKKQEFLDCLNDEEIAAPVILEFPPQPLPPLPHAVISPRCG